MALRGLMNSDPEQALPIIEKMLTGANSPKVKDRALFVLSQSDSARAREIIANVAKGNANPDLQLRAIQLSRHHGRHRQPADARRRLPRVDRRGGEARDPPQLHGRRATATRLLAAREDARPTPSCAARRSSSSA